MLIAFVVGTAELSWCQEYDGHSHQSKGVSSDLPPSVWQSGLAGDWKACGSVFTPPSLTGFDQRAFGIRHVTREVKPSR
jgi:hypothetical protein